MVDEELDVPLCVILDLFWVRNVLYEKGRFCAYCWFVGC